MSTLAIHRAPGSSQAITLPEPRAGAISIRQAMLFGRDGGGDLKFIDELHKKHSKMVGFFPRLWFEKNIEQGNVLIAEQVQTMPPGVSYVFSTVNVPVGYCVFKDKYLKREELGICYQLNVTPGKQRGLIGATLIKAVFDRAAYGCKLFCCWCAQDLEANHFWESIGFVPLAFRTGSRPRITKSGRMTKPGRTHIFWQRRIREGDTETPYWFPSETSGGAVRENRLVLPIPPGTHWSDAKPAVLPGMERLNEPRALASGGANGDPGAGAQPLPDGRGSSRRTRMPKVKALPAPKRPRCGVWFAPPKPTAEQIAAAKKAEKASKPKAPKMKNDPKLIAAARELRDRYTEQINAPGGLLLPPSACGKYDVSRQLDAAPTTTELKQIPLLEAA